MSQREAQSLMVRDYARPFRNFVATLGLTNGRISRPVGGVVAGDLVPAVGNEKARCSQDM